MQYVLEHGIKSTEEWPYSGNDGVCDVDDVRDSSSFALPELLESGLHQRKVPEPSIVSSGMVAWEKLPTNKYAPLMAALANHGPVAVSVAAAAWFGYSHGIFDGCDRDAVVDHAVTLIGYGHEDGEKYWNIKNSWSVDWGEDGYIRLLRRDDDDTAQCGVDRQPEVGTGCEGGPTEVPVCGMCGVLYDSVVPHFESISI